MNTSHANTTQIPRHKSMHFSLYNSYFNHLNNQTLAVINYFRKITTKYLMYKKRYIFIQLEGLFRMLKMFNLKFIRNNIIIELLF